MDTLGMCVGTLPEWLQNAVNACDTIEHFRELIAFAEIQAQRSL